jgi:predicted DNA-binding protein YlxM (UPF0122 family)
MNTYTELHKKAIITLNKYSLGGMLEKMEVTAIHDLIRKHKDRLIAIQSYEQGLILANEAITKMGFPFQIQMFIKDETDMRALYEILIEWRDSILIQ